MVVFNDVKDIFKDKRLHLSLIATYIIGLIAHGYCYFNLIYTHDSLLIYQRNDYEWQISLGRFLQPIYCKLFRGDIYAPALVGFLSLLFIALSVYIIVNLLDFKSKFQIIIISAIMTTNVTVTLLNATYMPWVDMFMFSSLSAVIGVYVLKKYRFGFIFAPFFFLISLGFYQAQLQVAVFLIMILILNDILVGQETKVIIHRIIKNLISIFSGLVLYYLVNNLVLKITGITMANTYNSLSNIGDYGSLKNIIYCIFLTYVNVLRYFIKYNSRFMIVINIAILLVAFISLIIITSKKNIKGLKLAILVLLILAMPFGINFVCFISQGVEHNLMMQSFVLVYILALYISNYAVSLNIKITNNKFIKFITPVFITILMFNNIVYANQAYEYKTLVVKNTESTFTRILDRVEQIDDYITNETPVAIIGKLCINDYTFNLHGTGLYNKYATTYYNTYKQFINDYLAYPMNIVSESESGEIAEQSYVKNMSNFPSKDSIQMVDGTLIIKLSDVEKIEGE